MPLPYLPHMFYLMVSGLTSYEIISYDDYVICEQLLISWYVVSITPMISVAGVIIPYADRGSQIVIKFVNTVEYRHIWTVGNIIPSHGHEFIPRSARDPDGVLVLSSLNII